MKKALVAAMMVLTLAVLAVAGPFAGYEHNIPSNVGDTYVGFSFGESALTFDVKLSIGDIWAQKKPIPGPDLGFGFEINYEQDIFETNTTLDFSLNEINCWPNVYLDGFELWTEMVVHLFPLPCKASDPCGDPILDITFAGGVSYEVVAVGRHYDTSIVPLGKISFHIEP